MYNNDLKLNAPKLFDLKIIIVEIELERIVYPLLINRRKVSCQKTSMTLRKFCELKTGASFLQHFY